MKSLAKQTAIYGISNITGRFLNWMLLPVYTRVLPHPGDYGVVTNLYGWTALLMALLTYGMETGMFRFINRKEETEPMRVYSSALYSLSFTSLLFIVLLLAFLTPVSDVLGYSARPEFVAMMGCIVAVDAFCCIPFAYLRYRNKAVKFAAFRLINIFLNIALNIFLLVVCPHIDSPLIRSWYDPSYGVGYIFIANALTTLITLLMLLPEITAGMRCRPDRERLKKILSYSFPILILSVAGIFSQTAAPVFFPFLFDNRAEADMQLGVYGACLKIAAVMLMCIQAFRYAYEPFVFARSRESDSKTSYVQAMKYFIIFSLAIFLGVMFYLDVIQYFIPATYHAGLGVIPVVMLGEVFFGIYFNLSVWYKLTDRTVWGAVFSITGCVATVLIILFFVPRYGFMACAYASFFSNLLMMLLSYFAGQRYYPVRYDLKSALIYGVLAAACYFAAMLPQIDSEIPRLAYRTVILLVFAGFALKRDFPTVSRKR